MCTCFLPTRRRFLLGIAGMAVLPSFTFADQDDAKVIGGQIQIDGKTSTSTSSPRFTLSAGALGGVVQSQDQIFSLDPETEAEFYKKDDGFVSQVVIKTGGLLSLFGPKSGKETVIKTPNAVGAIRGTTTYFAWQAKEQRSYVCCCYGGVDLANDGGGVREMRTKYHQGVILPMNGGIKSAPYDKPLAHYDDDIIALEEQAGRTPRWTLPNGQINFIAPRPAPLT